MERQSDTIQFTVIRGDGDWRVLRDGRPSGHFDFSVDAIESALVKATTLIDKGELPLGAAPRYGMKPTGATRPKPPFRRTLYAVIGLVVVAGGAAAYFWIP